MNADDTDADSSSSLSTKITVIVFWGLVIIGISFTGILLHNIKQDTLESRETIADSIAYYIDAIANDEITLSDLSEQSVSRKLNHIITSYENIKVELWKNNRLINYAENNFQSIETSKFIREINSPKNQQSNILLHVIFPSFDETIHIERKQLLVGLGALLLCFGVVLKLLLERILNLPMSNMVNTAQSISTGIQVEFDEKRDDEFGYLSRFINKAIKQLRISENESIRAREFAEVTLQSIGDGVVTTDATGKITMINSVAEILSGYTLESAQSKYLSEILPLVDEENGYAVTHPINFCLANKQTIEIDSNCALVRNDKSIIPVATSVAPITDNNENLLGAVMVFHDVSEARSLQRELSYQASHDHLTGLYNRREFDRELKQALAHAKRDNLTHTLCYLDLDQFKVINDTCGHAAGDVLLKELSDLIRNSLRKADVFARLGGDEFAVLLFHCSITQAKNVAENIRNLINDYCFQWEGKSFRVGVSIGITKISHTANNVDEVLATADMACYAAKEDGRNRVRVYQDDDTLLLRRRDEMNMVSAVRKALAEDRFELFVQPIVSTTDKEDCKDYEVLIRMKDEEGEYVLPYRFIPAAERYQLMSSIDRWVVHTSIMHMLNNTNNKDVSLAINLSGQSINEDDFLQFVIDEISKYSIDASRICFEITETAAVNNLSQAVSFIESLKQYKCRFSLDDFGTGVSSFEYLKRLPVDYLKIDGTFIKQMHDSNVDQAMVKAINEVAKVMGMQTIAEFVENEDIYRILHDIGVNFAQGYWVSKPKPIDKIIPLQHIIPVSSNIKRIK